MLIAVAAVDAQWGIGRDGDLLYNIPDDKKHFRDLTYDSLVIMGRKTLLSLPNSQPLKNRYNIVLSRDENFKVKNATVCHDIDEILSFVPKDERAFVIGGGEVYRALLPFCDKAVITKINAVSPADTYFPNLDEDEDWVLINQSESQVWEGIPFSYNIYERK